MRTPCGAPPVLTLVLLAASASASAARPEPALERSSAASSERVASSERSSSGASGRIASPHPTASSGQAAPRARAGAVPHLVLSAELTDDHRLRGTTVWRYVNGGAQPLDELHFILWSNFEEEPNPDLAAIVNDSGFFNSWEPTRTDVLGVRAASGESLEWRYLAAAPVVQTYSLGRVYLAVRLPRPLAAGEAAQVAIDFETLVPHRRRESGHFNGDTTWRFGWFPQPRHREAGGWSDGLVLTAFTHETTFTVPTHDDVAVIGADETGQEGRTARARSPVPVRSVPFVVSQRLRPTSARIDGVEVTVFTYRDLSLLDTSEGEADEKLAQLARILPFYREHYGPYRLRSLKVLESPSTDTAMAADGLVLLADLLFIYDRTWIAWGFYRPLGEIVLAHEVAHQWWGVGVGVDFDRTNWLSEGFSQMLAFDYGEQRFGRHGRDHLRPNWFLRWLFANLMGVALPTNQLDSVIQPSYEDHVRFELEEPLVLPYRELRHAEESAYRLYHKGYLGTRTLVALLGADGARQTLRRVYEERAGDVVTLDDLRDAATSVTGVDLGPYLDAFVLGNARADYSVASVASRPAGKGVAATISLRRDGELALPVNVLVTSASGKERRLTWGGAGASTELTIALDSAPRSVVVDPDAIVPDVDRANNSWPASTRFQWFAPEPVAGTYTWSLNPLPLHRRYVFGLTLAGRDANRSAWAAGAGVTGFLLPQAPAEQGQPYPYERIEAESVAFVEGAVALSRTTRLGLDAAIERFGLDTDANYRRGTIELTPTLDLFETTAVGSTGITEVPRTSLRLGVGYSQLAIDGGRRVAWASDAALYDDPAAVAHARGYLTGGVTRNELLNHGFALDLGLRAGGFRLPGGADEEGYSSPVGGLHPFGEAVLSGVYLAGAVPYVGRLQLELRAAGTTPGSIDSERVALPLLPVNDRLFAVRPYDAYASGGATLVVPVLRDLRMKNLLTAWLFVLNDLSLELRYAVAAGGVWRGPRDFVLVRRDPLGEVAAGLRFGIAAFDATPLHVTVAAGVPVWPSPLDGAGPTWFVSLSL